MAFTPNVETGVARSGRSPKIIFVVRAFGEADKGEWDKLLQESGSCNLFYDHRIISAAQLTWKKYQSLQVISGYLDDKLVFLQPVQITGSGIGKMLELLRLPTSDANEPLVSPGQWENATTSFLAFVSNNFTPDIIIAKSVSERFYSLLTSHFDEAYTKLNKVRTGFVLYLPSSIEEYWSSLKSKARNHLKRKLRKAQDAGFEFRVVHSSGSPSDCNLDRALGELTQLHRMRFDSMNRDSFFVKSDIQKFHRYLCESPSSSPVSFTFTEAVLDGEVVGSIYGMRSNQVYIGLMTGFNPGFAAYSLGILLIYSTIENLMRYQVMVFDFKCGKEAYKRWWTKDYYESYDFNICLNRRGRFLGIVLDLMNLPHRGRRLSKNIHKLVCWAGRILKKII